MNHRTGARVAEARMRLLMGGEERIPALDVSQRKREALSEEKERSVERSNVTDLLPSGRGRAAPIFVDGASDVS